MFVPCTSRPSSGTGEGHDSSENSNNGHQPARRSWWAISEGLPPPLTSCMAMLVSPSGSRFARLVRHGTHPPILRSRPCQSASALPPWYIKSCTSSRRIQGYCPPALVQLSHWPRLNPLVVGSAPLTKRYSTTQIVVVASLQGHNYATKRAVPVSGPLIGGFAFVLSETLATTPRLKSSVPTPRSAATGELG